MDASGSRNGNLDAHNPFHFTHKRGRNKIHQSIHDVKKGKTSISTVNSDASARSKGVSDEVGVQSDELRSLVSGWVKACGHNVDNVGKEREYTPLTTKPRQPRLGLGATPISHNKAMELSMAIDRKIAAKIKKRKRDDDDEETYITTKKNTTELASTSKHKKTTPLCSDSDSSCDENESRSTLLGNTHKR